MADVLFRFTDHKLTVAQQDVLCDINLTIARGERVALLGESGVGKSTLLAALRAQLPDAVAWCPQETGLVPNLSVLHNVYMGRLHVYPWWKNLWRLWRPGAQVTDEIAELLRPLGLLEFMHRPVESLSGGQQQRCNIARALYQRRPVFMGDEPVSALDEHQSESLLAQICEQHETVVLALHDVGLARRHCTRLIGLRAGRIALDSVPDVAKAPDLGDLYTSDLAKL